MQVARLASKDGIILTRGHRSLNKQVVKGIIRALAPQCLVNWYHRMGGRSVCFVGTYPGWQAAEKDATGYNAEAILQLVVEKTKLVVSGKVAYERDGVVFDEPAYPYPLLALLLRAAAANNNRLTVLDFGGSLGSTYRQCQAFLRGVSTLKWCVVEQRHYVDAGNTHFADEVLSFHESIAAASCDQQPNVVLFSSVLQYLPEPYAALEEAISRQPDYIVIDRTPFLDAGNSVLSLQIVPKNIVKASYPVWLFNEQTLKRVFVGRYVEIATFAAIDGTLGHGRLSATFKGVMLEKVNEKPD